MKGSYRLQSIFNLHRSVSLIALVLGAAGFAVACGGGDGDADPYDTPSTAGSGGSPDASPAGGAQSGGRTSAGAGGSAGDPGKHTPPGGEPGQGGGSGGDPSVGGDGGVSPGGTGGAGGAGATGGAAGSGGDAGDSLRIEDVECLYQTAGLPGVTEGIPVQCSFAVRGEPGRDVRLSCEAADGSPIDCSVTSTGMQVMPFGDQPLPVERAQWFAPSDGMAGSDVSVVVVASDGEESARQRIDVPVIADDGANEAPALAVDCGVAPGGVLSVAPGETHHCRVVVSDPDLDLVTFWVNLLSATPLVGLLSPAGVTSFGSTEFELSILPDPADSGKTFTYELSVDDGVAPAVKQTLSFEVP